MFQRTRQSTLLSFLLLSQLLAVSVAGDSVGDCVAIEFMADGHSQCVEMHRATDEAIKNGWVVRRIDTRLEPHVALRWQISNVPTTVLVRNGREVDRVLGPVSPVELQKRLEAASSVDSMRNSQDRRRDRIENESPMIRGQSQPNSVSSSPQFSSPNASASAPTNAPAIAPSNASFNPSRTMPNGLSPNAVSSIPRDPPSLTSPLAASRVASNPQGATVRIRVEEPKHESVGTGTVIDSVNGEALVLTCGHLFRENNGQAKITVETFLNGQIQIYPATLIDFQAKDMDIGLIAFRPNASVPVARLIPKNRALTEGQPVFSWGCDRGAMPSRRDSKITKLNRYLGAANVEVGGEPVEGRSGGGLFDENGELIGVCYAADPELKEGLYNAAEVVYFELAKLGLQRLFNERMDAPPIQSVATTATLSDQRQEASAPPELTVILRGRDGKQEQLNIPQPSPQLLQALRDSTRR